MSFDTAEYYGTSEDGDGATHSCPEDAIDEAAGYCDEDDSITVYGFDLEQPKGWLTGVAKDAAETAVDSVYEMAELSFDDTWHSDEVLNDVRRAVIADVCRVLRGYGFLELTGERTYSADEVRAILGEP